MVDEKIYDYVKNHQSKKRFVHTIGVSYTSCSLAMRYGIDINKAFLAGFLHDVAKGIEDSKLIDFCKENNVDIPEVCYLKPFLLHGPAGRVIAKNMLGIDDEDILSAIEFHTTGRPGMSLLEKIVFVADYIEPGRNKAPNLEYIRKLAFENIDSCVIKILEDTFSYLNDADGIIAPMAKDALSYYKESTLH